MNMNQLCLELRNFFQKEIVQGDFTIESGTITPLPDSLKENQYFRIVGSDMNDGVYTNTASGLNTLIDEEFSGSVWVMAVPPDVISLLSQINDWEAKNSGIINSPYTSENYFGDYSYTISSGNGGKTDKSTWQGAFAQQLRPYRRLTIL